MIYVLKTKDRPLRPVSLLAPQGVHLRVVDFSKVERPTLSLVHRFHIVYNIQLFPLPICHHTFQRWKVLRMHDGICFG